MNYINFVLTCKSHAKKEVIDRIKASCLSEAVEIFSQKKQLDVDTFNEIFEVTAEDKS